MMTDRYNLSHAMYIRLMGRFLDLRRSGSQPTTATDTALERRGLLDGHGRRTEAGLIYILKNGVINATRNLWNEILVL